MTNEAKTDLIAMPSMNLPEPAFVQEKINEAFTGIYSKIEKEIADTPVDMTSKKGRDAVRSLAYKISQTKTGLDESAVSLTADQKAIIDAVNSERREMKTRLDELKEKARKPLTDWEEAEKKRKAAIEEGLACLRDLGRVDAMTDPEQIKNVMSSDALLFSETEWGEYQEQAKAVYVTATEKFTADLAASEKRIADEKELEQLRALKAEQERKEAEEREKLEAAEAKEREEKAEREAEERRQVEAKERAELEAKEKIEAEQERARLAEERAEQAKADAKAAEEKAKADQAAAVEAERKRIELEQAQREAEEKAAEEARAADLKHRKKINNAVLEAMKKASEITDDQAKMIIQAIAKGQVPHVEIKY